MDLTANLSRLVLVQCPNEGLEVKRSVNRSEVSFRNGEAAETTLPAICPPFGLACQRPLALRLARDVRTNPSNGRDGLRDLWRAVTTARMGRITSVVLVVEHRHYRTLESYTLEVL